MKIIAKNATKHLLKQDGNRRAIMSTELPIEFRAETVKQNFKEETSCLKKINGKWFVFGNYIENKVDAPCIIDEDAEQYEIKKRTLAIHFPDMLTSDSDRLIPNGEKDLRIFASLSKDGSGSDTILYHSAKWVVIYLECELLMKCISEGLEYLETPLRVALAKPNSTKLTEEKYKKQVQ